MLLEDPAKLERVKTAFNYPASISVGHSMVTFHPSWSIIVFQTILLLKNHPCIFSFQTSIYPAGKKKSYSLPCFFLLSDGLVYGMHAPCPFLLSSVMCLEGPKWRAPQERESEERDDAKNTEICFWETWIPMFYTWNKPREINVSS